MRSPEWGKESTNVDELELRHKHVECWPSFDAIRQYEWVRREGKFNMLTEQRQVSDEMHRLGFYDALEWLVRCSQEKIFFGTIYSHAMEHYRKDIPVKDWFDKEFLRGIKQGRKRALQDELAALQRKIDEMED